MRGDEDEGGEETDKFEEEDEKGDIEEDEEEEEEKEEEEEDMKKWEKGERHCGKKNLLAWKSIVFLWEKCFAARQKRILWRGRKLSFG